MKKNTNNTRMLFLATLVSLASLAHFKAGAQTYTSATSSTEEQNIRERVARFEAGEKLTYTDNRIFVSGAYPTPIIGKEMSEENKAIHDKMEKERLNFRSKHRIQRVEVAKANDMAYEFGFADLSWDTPEKKHVSFESTYLRIWRKVDGEWKVDAFFARPNGKPEIK